MKSRLLAKISVLLAFTLLLVACTAEPAPSDYTVVASYPHDTTAFTQGLVFHENTLYESTGLYGQSSLRQVDVSSGEVRQKVALPTNYFGEGLALVDETLVQLTWKQGKAFIYELSSLESSGAYSYSGEGWGLCFDGRFLYRSDGSSTLYLHNPRDFSLESTLTVSSEEMQVRGLNELECVDGSIYANVWLTDTIVRVDKISGRVQSTYDLSGLLNDNEYAELHPEAVLNGIAYNETSKTFFVTGKLWPRLFELKMLN